MLSGQVKVAKGHFSRFVQYNRMDLFGWRRSDIGSNGIQAVAELVFETGIHKLCTKRQLCIKLDI